MLVSVVRGCIQERTRNFDILFTKHVREIVCEVFINSIKSKRSPKIMKRVEMCDIICGGYDKNFRRFRARCHVRCLQTRTSLYMILPPFLNISHIVFSTNINVRLGKGCEIEKKRKIRPSSLSQSDYFLNLRGWLGHVLCMVGRFPN